MLEDDGVLEFKVSRRRLAVALLLVLSAMTFAGLVGHGDIVTWRLPPEIATVLLVALVPVVPLVLINSLRIDFSRPMMTLSAAGINHQALSKTIPWSSIEAVTTNVTFKTESLHVVLRSDADVVLLAELSRWNHRIFPRMLVVHLSGFENVSSMRAKAMVFRWFEAYR